MVWNYLENKRKQNNLDVWQMATTSHPNVSGGGACCHETKSEETYSFSPHDDNIV